MKRISIYILSVIFMAGLGTSCNNFLDTLPDNRTEINTTDKLAQLLVAAYPEASWIAAAEISSDNYEDNGSIYDVTYQFLEHYYLYKDVTEVSQDTPYYFWTHAYRAIASCNLAIDYIEQLGFPKELDGYLAEALLCRAYNHFNLVNLFSQHYDEAHAKSDLGIPYVEELETTLLNYYERGTVAQVYEKINRDIERALPLVNESLYKVPKYHFNLKAAYAFAARFHLYWGKDMNKVVEYATNALGTNVQSVLRDWDAVRAVSMPADKSKAYLDPEQDANLLLIASSSRWYRIYGAYSTNTRYTHSININSFETLWSTSLIQTTSPPYPYASLYGGTVQRRCFPKMTEFFVVNDFVNNTGSVHLVQNPLSTNETLLCRAEAYTRMGMFSEALQDLTYWGYNMGRSTPITMSILNSLYGPTAPFGFIKKRINPGFTIEAGDMETIIHSILHARRIESIHEGLRWFDLKRYGITVEHKREYLSTLVLDKRDPRFAIQLPADVINAGMTPNPR